jgi:hypothetical protein
MTRPEMIDRIRRARALARAVYDATDLPQIQLILRHADQNLHWALWNLGQVDELRPDLPGSVVETTRRKQKAKRPTRRSARRS